MSRHRLWALLFGFALGTAAATACGPTDELLPVPSAEEPGFSRAYADPEEARQAAEELSEAPPPLTPEVSRPAEIVHHGSRSHMRIALTFDACSTRTNQFDERIVRTLEATGTPATIFIGGAWSQAQAEQVKALAANPLFELGNHSYTHPHFTRVKDDRRILDELLRTQRAIYDLTGRVPQYFRPPYGEVDARVAKLVAQAGLTTIQYDLASGDPDKNATQKRLVDWVLRQARPGGIVVMHMNHLRFHTAQALPEIIAGLRKKGYELVTVGALLQDEADPVCRLEDSQAPMADARTGA